MAKVITAKMAGVCDICGEKYQPGTRIALERRTGNWIEADCLWPGKIGKKAENHAEVQEETISEVSARLDAAIRILCGRFGKLPVDINIDSPVLAELLHQLGASVWLDKVK